MGRKVLCVITWVVYIALLFITVLWEAAALRILFPGDYSLAQTAFGMHVSLHWAAVLAIPVIALWWLKSATWGTFGTYGLVLGVAFGLKSFEYFVLGNGFRQWTCLLAMLVTHWLALGALAKHVIHARTVWRNTRPRPDRRRH